MKSSSKEMAAAIIVLISEIIFVIVFSIFPMSQGFAIFFAICLGICTIGSFSGIFECSLLIGKTYERGKAIVGLVFSIIGTNIGIAFWIGFLIGCAGKM